MKLADFQKARGLSNLDLAVALDTSEVTISRYKSNKPKTKRVPRSDILDKIRKLSGGLVDYDDFIADSTSQLTG